jgi:hypothetical protein
VSAPSLVKTKRVFRECKLGKEEDPVTWTTNLEDLQLKMKLMGLFMIDDQFMFQTLNISTMKYKLQMLVLESGLETSRTR